MQLTTSSDRLAAVDEWPAPIVATAIAVALALVFMLDRASGSAPVQHLYYVPIILTGIRFRRRGGAIAALLSIGLYHLANPHLLTFNYEEHDLVQIVLFVAVGLITATLTDDADRLRRLASTDDLTGLHNLRSFEAHLDRLLRDARRSGAPLAILVLDVDRLKSLNDRYGHLTGAEAVRTVGRLIAVHLPPPAVACRYGGDEFAIVLPDCSPITARRAADRLCEAVRGTVPVLAGRAFSAGTLSVSIGGASASYEAEDGPGDSGQPDEAGEALFNAADRALYRAKDGGRNQVCVWPDLLGAATLSAASASPRS